MYKIYGKNNCIFCEKAKQLLESCDLEYQYYTVGEDITKSELIEMVGNDVKTVPQIFKNNEYIGGYTELHKIYINKGNL